MAQELDEFSSGLDLIRDKKGTILVCVDTLNPSRASLRYACYKAKKSNLAVQIVTVVEPSHQNLIFGSKDIGRQKRTMLENSLKALTDEIFTETGVMPAISIREGDIAREILMELRSINDCVMAMFSKSSDSLSDDTLLPKILKKIGLKIKVPILIIPKNIDEELLKSAI